MLAEFDLCGEATFGDLSVEGGAAKAGAVEDGADAQNAIGLGHSGARWRWLALWHYGIEDWSRQDKIDHPPNEEAAGKRNNRRSCRSLPCPDPPWIVSAAAKPNQLLIARSSEADPNTSQQAQGIACAPPYVQVHRSGSARFGRVGLTSKRPPPAPAPHVDCPLAVLARETVSDG